MNAIIFEAPRPRYVMEILDADHADWRPWRGYDDREEATDAAFEYVRTWPAEQARVVDTDTEPTP